MKLSLPSLAHARPEWTATHESQSATMAPPRMGGESHSHSRQDRRQCVSADANSLAAVEGETRSRANVEQMACFITFLSDSLDVPVGHIVKTRRIGGASPARRQRGGCRSLHEREHSSANAAVRSELWSGVVQNGGAR